MWGMPPPPQNQLGGGASGLWESGGTADSTPPAGRLRRGGLSGVKKAGAAGAPHPTWKSEGASEAGRIISRISAAYSQPGAPRDSSERDSER